MRTIALLHRLRRDRRGATIIEFAIVAPVMMIMLMGLGELLYQPYLQSILEGAVQKAGRDSTLEDSAEDTGALDARVQAMVSMIGKDAEFFPERRSYSSFALIKPEPFRDLNNNGILDNKECFDDVNGNGVWDRNPSRAGQGGADDVTRYTMRVRYPRLFPVVGLLGMSAKGEIQASTLLKNQPYKSQTQYTVQEVCLK